MPRDREGFTENTSGAKWAQLSRGREAVCARVSRQVWSLTAAVPSHDDPPDTKSRDVIPRLVPAAEKRAGTTEHKHPIYYTP